MKAAAVLEPGRVGIVDIPIPSFGDYECLVKIKACGFCNSTDQKIISNHAADMSIHYPTILGHEGVGIIVQTGAHVRNWRVGDRIVSPIGRISPECHFSSNFGQMAEYGITHDIQAMVEDHVALGVQPPLPDYRGKRIPEDMADVDAVMLLTLKENYSALKNFGFSPGMKILVYGDGPVAMGLCTLARAMDAGFVACIGHHDNRLSALKNVSGADVIINSHTEKIADQLQDVRFDIAIDAVGDVEIVTEAAHWLVPGGRVCVYGVMKKGMAMLNLHSLPNNICVQTLSWPYHEHRTHEAVLELISQGIVRPKDFYSHVMPLEAFTDGLSLIQSRKALKVIFVMP